jgi:hypothetical protein
VVIVEASPGSSPQEPAHDLHRRPAGRRAVWLNPNRLERSLCHQ